MIEFGKYKYLRLTTKLFRYFFVFLFVKSRKRMDDVVGMPGCRRLVNCEECLWETEGMGGGSGWLAREYVDFDGCH